MPAPNREIEGLIARVEAATGPDREIDAEITSMFRIHWTSADHWISRSPEVEFRPVSGGGREGWLEIWMPGEAEPRDKWTASKYTASVDAALALVERVLTGPQEPTFSLDHASFGANWTCEFHWFINPAWHARADAPTAPLAILLALLRALSAKAAP